MGLDMMPHMWRLTGGSPDRQRNGINARSNVDIWRADHDLYLACIDHKVGCSYTKIVVCKLAAMVRIICISWKELAACSCCILC